MALDSIVSLIKKLRIRIEQYEELLCESEMLTRYVLIDPLVRELGWDLENPDQVRPEYKRKADYALLAAGRVIFIIEAKKLNTPLHEGLSQGIRYCIEEGAPYFVITDGRRWEIYDSHKTVPIEEKRIKKLDVCAFTPQEVALDSLFLWQEHPGTAQLLPKPSPIEAPPPDRISTLSRENLRALPDGICLIRASKPDGIDFLLKYKAWGFIGQPHRDPRYLALYVSDPISAVKYLGEVGQVLDPSHPSSPVRNEYREFDTYKAGRKVMTLRQLWKLERPIPKGRRGGLAWPLYCSLRQLAKASDLDNLFPPK